MGNNTTTYRGAGGQNSSSIAASLVSVAAVNHAASGKAAIPRRVDPRVSVAVLVLLNVTVFLAPLPIELAAAATGVAVMCWCGRFTSAARWSAAYALMLAGGYALVMAGEAFMPFAVSLTMLRRVMAVTDSRGRSSQLRSCRPPMAVLVLSSTQRREPFFSLPRSVSVSSRLRARRCARCA